MNNFKDLAVEAPPVAFSGLKLKIDQLKGREIIVFDFKIEISKYPKKGKDKYMNMQFAIGETKYISFTQASALMAQMQSIPKDKFPFKTTIIQVGERLEFS